MHGEAAGPRDGVQYGVRLEGLEEPEPLRVQVSLPAGVSLVRWEESPVG